MGINKSGWKPEYRDVLTFGALVVPCAVTADATGGIAFALPYSMVIVDLVARSTATNALGTVTVSDGSDDISNAIDVDTIDTNISAGTIDSTFATTDAVTLTTNGAADRCVVYVIGYIA